MIWLNTIFAIMPLPLGAKTSSMGGAGTAKGSDSAMPLINPAGLALVPENSLGFSLSLYGYNSFSAENPGAPNGFAPNFGETSIQKNDFESNEFNALPGTGTVVYQFGEKPGTSGHQAIGFFFAQIEHDNLSISSPFEAEVKGGSSLFRDNLTFINTSESYLLGPSYALQLDMFRIGVSLPILYHKNFRSIQSSRMFIKLNGLSHDLNSSYEYSESSSFGLLPIAGVQTTLFDKLHLGISFKAPTLHLDGDYKYSYEETFNKTDGVEENYILRVQGKGDFEYHQPMSLRAGAAFDFTEHFSTAADFEFFFAEDSFQQEKAMINSSKLYQNQPPEVSREKKSYERKLVSSFAIHGGIEITLSKDFSLMAGGFYAPSNIDKKTMALFDKRMNYSGGNIGFSSEHFLGSTTLGISYIYGSGVILVPDKYSGKWLDSYVEAKSHALFLVVAGSFDFEKFKSGSQKILPIK